MAQKKVSSSACACSSGAIVELPTTDFQMQVLNLAAIWHKEKNGIAKVSSSACACSGGAMVELLHTNGQAKSLNLAAMWHKEKNGLEKSVFLPMQQWGNGRMPNY